MALGDFDFPGLYGANLFLGPFMFLTYVFAVTMLLLNMFLAVVMAVYEDVKASLEKQPDELSTSMRAVLKNKLKKFFSGFKKKSAKVQQGVEAEAGGGDNVLTDKDIEFIFNEDADAFKDAGINSVKELQKITVTTGKADPLDEHIDLKEIRKFESNGAETAREEDEEEEEPEDAQHEELVGLLMKVMERINRLQEDHKVMATKVNKILVAEGVNDG